ncbi:MAG: hypothetical protein Q4F69_01070 [Bacteroidia bacterium]|nr:hypothetical protein [Bacteroidia bacterium]
MIKAVSNPPMGNEDIKEFRRIVCGDASSEERESQSALLKKIISVGVEVTKNNGGKNPILEN